MRGSVRCGRRRVCAPPVAHTGRGSLRAGAHHGALWRTVGEVVFLFPSEVAAQGPAEEELLKELNEGQEERLGQHEGLVGLLNGGAALHGTESEKGVDGDVYELLDGLPGRRAVADFSNRLHALEPCHVIRGYERLHECGQVRPLLAIEADVCADQGERNELHEGGRAARSGVCGRRRPSEVRLRCRSRVGRVRALRVGAASGAAMAMCKARWRCSPGAG